MWVGVGVGVYHSTIPQNGDIGIFTSPVSRSFSSKVIFLSIYHKTDLSCMFGAILVFQLQNRWP